MLRTFLFIVASLLILEALALPPMAGLLHIPGFALPPFVSPRSGEVLLKFAACAGFILLALRAINARKGASALLCGMLALAVNPMAPLHFGPGLDGPIRIAAAVLLLLFVRRLDGD